jgi:hypothetical protein
MAVPWVVDRGLNKLLEQINAAAPGRSKVSDGSIGDPAHQATESDHNPEHPPPSGNPDFQVDARDFTQDPAHNADMGVVSEAIRQSHDRRVSYVIFNRRIFSGLDGPQPWVWRPYSGTDPHTNHMHVSVRDSTHDQTQDWSIGIHAPTSPEPPMTLPDGFSTTFNGMVGEVDAMIYDKPKVVWGPLTGQENLLHTRLVTMEAKLDLVTNMLKDLSLASGLDPAALQTAFEAALAAKMSEIADAVVDEEHQRLGA